MKKPLPSAQRIEETTPRRGLFRFGVLFGVKWVGLFLAAVYCAVVGAALAAKLLSFGLSGTPACRGGWDIGFALLGESLFLEWPRKSNQKEGHPCIRTRRPRLASQNFPRSGAAPGAGAKGHPCPIAPRSASMPRVPLRSTYARPPEGDSSPSRLDVFEQQQSAFLI